MSHIKNGLAATLLVSLAALSAGVLGGCAVESPDPQDEGASEDVGAATEAVLSSSGNQGFGWVKATLLSVGTIAADPTGSYNSAGGANTVTNTSTGNYRVDFPLLAGAGGNVQVVASGNGTERCKVQNWGSFGTTLSVGVLCFTAAGAPVNTYFDVFYGREATLSDGAYLWNDQPSAPLNTAYTPWYPYQYTMGSSYSTMVRTAVGSYVATLVGVPATGSNVQVTAYGSGPEHCKVVSWVANGANTQVSVRCFGAAGTPADSMFTMGYHIGKPSSGLTGAFAYGSDPVSSSYTPPPLYTGLYNYLFPFYAGVGISISHTFTGTYAVTLPRMTLPGAAFVTAYGSGSEYCKIASTVVPQNSNDVVVYVRCLNASGTPTDTRFSVSYSGNEAFQP